MKEQEVECILERAKELYPAARPRIISDNGPQFVAKDFKEFIRVSGMSHVRISPYYPQSNGKIERWHQTLKGDAVRPAQPATREEAQHIVAYTDRTRWARKAILNVAVCRRFSSDRTTAEYAPEI